ncbi:sugar phosphate isomerase/epimerase family protein [Paenibacillus pasadenensis]|uniref:sugar phosphate isomerase/epimerase family protein n=1 Tax=Paenibacillus pasadenensis TaxID=217090 RepID=UPI0003F8939A|nr:sugar phosphate isomerase/epimerase [Paenibacillus pasadenensis]
MTYNFAFSRPTATSEEEQLLVHGYQKAGYSGLQLKPSQYTPYLLEPESFRSRWGQPAGIAAALIAGGTLLNDDSREQLRQVYKFAAHVDSEMIVYCHAVPRQQVTNENIATFAAVFEEMGKEAEQQDLRLSLHHHYDQPLMHREDFDLFFDRIKNPAHVGLTIDTAHLVKSGVDDIAEVIRTFAPFITNFHMKDFAKGHFEILGHGEIDFSPVFQAIQDIRYSGWISADEESGGEIATGMKECLKFMKLGLGA